MIALAFVLVSLTFHLFSKNSNILSEDGNQSGAKVVEESSYGKSASMYSSNVEGDAANIDKDEREEEEGSNDTNYTDDLKVGDMWHKLNCEDIFQNVRPIHSTSTWNKARDLYRSIVGKNIRGDFDDKPDGFSVPVEAKQSPPKGRGIFAARDIAAGDLIWSTKKTARFQDGPSYRKFIFGLEVGFACDVLQWAYVQDIGDGDYRVSVDLDEGCFCNNGGEDEANKGCDEEAAEKVEGGCKENYFALRDIKAGEELLCSYGEFAVSNGWSKFGL